MAVAVRAIAAPSPRSRPRRRPRLVLARARSGKRAARMPFALLSLLVVTGMVLVLTGVQVLVAQGAFQLSELTEQAELLQVERDLLRLRLARLSSPDRVARAGGNVGLVLAEQVEVLPSPTHGPASPTRGSASSTLGPAAAGP